MCLLFFLELHTNRKLKHCFESSILPQAYRANCSGCEPNADVSQFHFVDWTFGKASKEKGRYILSYLFIYLYIYFHFTLSQLVKEWTVLSTPGFLKMASRGKKQQQTNKNNNNPPPQKKKKKEEKRLEEDLSWIVPHVPPTTQPVRALSWTELNWTEEPCGL